MPRKPKLQPWEEELIDLGWERDPSSTRSHKIYHYRKRIYPEYLFIKLYDHRTIGIEIADARTYKIVETTTSYPSIRVVIERIKSKLLGQIDVVTAYYFVETSTTLYSQLLCLGTLRPFVENIKKIPDMLKVTTKAVFSGDDVDTTIATFSKNLGYTIEPSDVIF